jgi:hypothetical protein
MTKEEQGKKIGQIIAKAWADEAFKKRLLADATVVLKEEGVDVPEGMEVKAVENSEKVFHLVIPPKQASGELGDTELGGVVGGAAICNFIMPDTPRCGGKLYW